MMSERLAPNTVEVVHVGTVMHKGVIGCKPSTPLDEVIRIMADTNVQVLVVTGPDEEALGTISQMDLLSFYGQDHKGLKARDVMSGKVIAVPPEMPLQEAIQIMMERCYQPPGRQRARRRWPAGAGRADDRAHHQGDARQQVDVVLQP